MCAMIRKLVLFHFLREYILILFSVGHLISNNSMEDGGRRRFFSKTFLVFCGGFIIVDLHNAGKKGAVY